MAVPHLPISPGGLVFHVLCNDQQWTLGFGCMLQNGQDALDLKILSEIRNWRCFPQLLRATKEAGKSVPICFWWIYPLRVMLNAPWGPVQTRSSCRKSKPMAWTARISAPEAGNLWLLPIKGVMCRPSVHQPTGGKRWETNNISIQLDYLRNLGHTGMHTWRHIYMPDLRGATHPIKRCGHALVSVMKYGEMYPLSIFIPWWFESSPAPQTLT